ncbi:MAG: rRNA pseudouridine synthase [Lachnospiraceae bacterium]|nr:rRNA pseudouridine synthase [Lachnospiraceae bacterium]
MKEQKSLRLDKYLADMQYGTRSQIKEIIRKGRITVDGAVIKSADIKVIPGTNVVTVDGVSVSYAEFEYYILNKPAGVVSATEDNSCKTVLDCIEDKQRKDLFPVGRLDKDTEGLLLITNDGQMAHALLSPKKHVDKVYYAEIDGDFDSEMKEKLERGVSLGDFVTMPAVIKILEKGQELSKIEITIREGKFHQVKRMFEAVGRNVTYLKRLSMGPLKLDEALFPGDYRVLTEEELGELKRITEKE